MASSDAVLIPVLPAHRFDEEALRDCLAQALPDFPRDAAISQFQGGQSNPTFLLEGEGRKLVLRKKPPGKILPRAHNVEREFRILHALAHTPVPVPRVHILCEDASVIGTAFYVMDFLEGEMFSAPATPGLAPAMRTTLHHAAIDALAAVHNVDFRAVGLGDLGPTQNYVARQVDRWTRQYEASQVAGAVPDLAWLAGWLRERQNVPDETTIAHGDFRFGNLCFRRSTHEVEGILDWELATLGHPASDLAYLCMPYHIPREFVASRGILGHDLDAMGIPSEAEMLARYAERTGRRVPEAWPLFLALSFFRLAAIVHGVMARSLQGNASNADAGEVGKRATLLSAIGREIAERTPS